MKIFGVVTWPLIWLCVPEIPSPEADIATFVGLGFSSPWILLSVDDEKIL